MAKTKKKPSFADRARKIVKKYPRASFDPIEKGELEDALAELQAEQEAYKQANGIGQPEVEQPQPMMGGQEQMTPQGQMPMGQQQLPPNIMDGYGTSYMQEPTNFVPTDGAFGRPAEIDVIRAKRKNPAYNIFGGDRDEPNIGLDSWMLGDDNNMSGLSAGSEGVAGARNERNIALEPWMMGDATDKSGLSAGSAGVAGATKNLENPINPFASPSTSITPQLATGALTIAGNLFMANRAKKQANKNQITPGLIAPEEISLSRARNAAEGRASLERKIGQRNLANTARNRGQLMAGTSALSSSMGRGLSETISGLYGKEEEINFGARTRANEINTQMKSDADRMNLQSKAAGNAESNNYLAGAIQVPGQVMRDINQSKQQDQMIGSMGQDYRWVDYTDPATGKKTRRMAFMDADGNFRLTNRG